MKKTAKYILGLLLAVGFTQCKLDTDLYQEINTEDAFVGAQDVQNALNGAYQQFGDYTFYGCYVPAASDMISDVSLASPSSGHFAAINEWGFDEYNTELTDIWSSGYKILDRCVRGINGGKALLAAGISLDDSISVFSSISQMYSLRAITSLVLVNLFATPYVPGTTNDSLGIVIVDQQPIKEFAHVTRSTVGQTYNQILSDITNAKLYMSYLPDETKESINQFYFNEAAIYALEARVKLYMKDYDGAKVAAQQAIDLRASGDETFESYVAMWRSTAITKEDIFTIVKSDNDNLSANSLNSLYSTYESSISNDVTSLFDSLDIRNKLIDVSHPKKFDGTATSADVSNIPVFRKSEMYLILAEANLKSTTIDTVEAKKALLYTAKRDSANFKTVADLPSNLDSLIQMVAEERVREFFTEGHRYFDLKRTGVRTTILSDPNFYMSKFVFPIPGSEVDAGFGVLQNENWYENIPQSPN